MAFSDQFQYNLEGIGLYFQGGVRKIFVVLGVIMFVLLLPIYFGGVLLANSWRDSNANPNKYSTNNIVIPKVVRQSKVEITNSQKVDLADGRSILYAFLDNSKNIDIGFDPFVYRQQILDRNGQLVSDTVSSTYILPGGTQYVIKVVDSQEASEIRIGQEPETKLIPYNPNNNSIFKRPKLNVRNPRFSVVDDQTLTLAATIKNVDDFFVDKIDVVFLLRDARGAIVGLGDYNFRGLVPEQERDIRIDLPKPLNRTPSDVEIFWQVNFLQQDNIRVD
jgi:hypothetical protein